MALGSILVLAMILLAVGLSMAFSGFVSGGIVYNQDKASFAFYTAEAGAKDAMMKVARNKDYNNAGYNLAVDSGNASVVVAKDTPVPGQTQISSTGVSENNTKKVQVILNVGANGNITVNSWQEVAN